MQGARRIFAVVLLVLFQLPFAAVFASGEEANLPACCRRLGHHKCVLHTGHTGDQGTSLESSRCPLFPCAITAPLNRIPVLAGTPPRIPMPDEFVAATLALSDAGPAGSPSRDYESRGPPLG